MENLGSKVGIEVMYLVQYMPTIGFWLMDNVLSMLPSLKHLPHSRYWSKWVEAAAQKGNTYLLNLLFGKNKAL
ncbi:hypothetical protein LOK49_LG14G02258 [Camellia lanceoleosa]|uniref:Uncharacterized protein n=1 Tax=Camellia lanceoleosa TaxID=1840588 RepID=A0ACC0FED6_9ERIC|nr:hypothetical protein LOK49_LG14G02258 [Camellia lanceoleosa]